MINFKFNTGTYELLKSAIDDFYSYGEMAQTCSKTQVHDKLKRIVETKYKVQCHKNTYTLNMYHTRSSWLVNGKGVEKFMDKHLPVVVSSVEKSLAEKRNNN